MNSTSFSIDRSLHSPSTARVGAYPLGFEAMLKLIVLCLMGWRHAPFIRFGELKRLEATLNMQLAFMWRLDVQLVLLGGASALLPRMHALGLALMVALALIVLTFYALCALLRLALNIIRSRQIAKSSNSRLLADYCTAFVNRTIPPALRPPLLTA